MIPKRRSANPGHAAISGQLRMIIAGRGLTAYAVARSADLSPSVVSRFLTRERGLTLETFDAIAGALGLKLVETGRGRGRQATAQIPAKIYAKGAAPVPVGTPPVPSDADRREEDDEGVVLISDDETEGLSDSNDQAGLADDQPTVEPASPGERVPQSLPLARLMAESEPDPPVEDIGNTPESGNDQGDEERPFGGPIRPEFNAEFNP